jgi:arsenate reductase
MSNNGSAKPLALFVCIHNSARSQMAEGFARRKFGDHIDVMSAGLERGKLNPVVVEVMLERGIDLSKNTAKSLEDIGWRTRDFAYVITVCDDASPVVSTSGERLHWSFPDPSAFSGTPEEIRQRTRDVRDQIEHAIDAWQLTETANAR